MAPFIPRKIELGIEGSRVLKLGIAGLPPKGIKATDALRIERSHEVGRGGKARNSVEIEHTGSADQGRYLAGHDVIEGEAGFEQRCRGKGPGVAGRGALGDGVDVSIAAAARKP